MSYPSYGGWCPHYYPRPYYYSWIREYPQIKTDTLNQSIQGYYPLMEEGYKILNRLSDHAFAVQVMTAAQAGNKQEVDRLMKSISGRSKISSEFSPSGIGITVDPLVETDPCCKLAMFLKWGK